MATVKPLVVPTGLSAADQQAVAKAYAAGGGSSTNLSYASSTPAPTVKPLVVPTGLSASDQKNVANAYTSGGGTTSNISYAPPPNPASQAGMLTAVGNGTFKDASGNPYDGSGQKITTPTISNVDISRSNLIQNQANTAQTNPLNDPNSPLTANLKSATDAYSTLKSKIAAQFGTMEQGDEALPTVLGREGALAKQYAGQLDALATNVNTAQTAMSQAVAAYNAQTGAQNAVTSQTQPAVNTQQVGMGTTVLGANNQPLVTTPSTASPGTALFSPTPTTYGSNGATSSSSGGTGTYSIKSGDTFYKLANGNQAQIAALEAANPGVNPNNLQIGQSINMPGSGAGAGGSVGTNLIGSPATAGTVSAQQSLASNVVVMKSAYNQATGIHSQISQLLQQNPTLNSNPVALGNAISQWVNTTAVPSGPYVKLLTDLQEYANTIAPVLGVASNNVTDAKMAIANQMVPTLLNGGTMEEALTNLEILAAGKINQAQQTSQNPFNDITAPSPMNNSMSGSTPSGQMFGSFF